MLEIQRYADFEAGANDNVYLTEHFREVDALVEGQGADLRQFATPETRFADELENELTSLAGELKYNPDEASLREFEAKAVRMYTDYFAATAKNAAPGTVRYVDQKAENLLRRMKLISRAMDFPPFERMILGRGSVESRMHSR